MFFSLSKIFWMVAAPSNILALMLVIAAVAHFTRWKRTARTLSVAVAALYILLAVFPTGTAIMRTLEDRFPAPGTSMPDPTGIIVLGGGIDEVITASRGITQLGEGGSRMTQAALLARRFPNARLVFTGGSGRLNPGDETEADAARRFFAEEGFPPERLIVEDRSRNTWENGVFTRELVGPLPGENWLLVTSAFHMPRSVGIFRRVGFDVTPWPADYMTSAGPYRILPNHQAGRGLDVTDRALREYVGLVVYYLAGKTSALFPAP
jgi:uncharacterized SAM-binding protein YcdF (DUF218 family)